MDIILPYPYMELVEGKFVKLTLIYLTEYRFANIIRVLFCKFEM